VKLIRTMQDKDYSSPVIVLARVLPRVAPSTKRAIAIASCPSLRLSVCPSAYL